MKKISIIFLLSLIFLNNCGFEIVNKSKLNNFKISEINTEGDNKINFRIKNKLKLISKKEEAKSIKIYLNTKKNKSVKEKNIKNEITKYEIKIITKVSYSERSDFPSKEFKITKSGDYKVSSQYTQTLENEKKLVRNLTDKISDEILDELTTQLNDI